MSKPTIVVVGLGAIGSHFIYSARDWDVQFRLIDFDRVEQKNVRAQMHSRMSIGKNKAKAIQAAFASLFGMRNIGAITSKVTQLNIEQVIGRDCVVIDATDNMQARQDIQDYCKAIDISCVHGCIAADGQFARIVWTEHFAPDAENEEGEATSEDGRHLPFHVRVGAQLAQVVQWYLEDGVKQSYQMTPSVLLRLV